MRRLSLTPAIRVSLGLAMFTMTLLLGLEMFGVFPDPQEFILDSRKKTCESLAVYGSLAIQKGNLHGIEKTMEVLMERNEDILSTALRKNNGKVLVQVGDHEQHWDTSDANLSTLRNVQVPIYKGKVRWGSFEVSFAGMNTNVFKSLWDRPIIKIMVLVIPLAFVGFFLLMKKTLRHLDPTVVVPERVKLALDTLVEGVVLMDRKERIVLANKAFEKTMGNTSDEMVGRKASELKWMIPESGKKAEVYPWREAIREGTRQSAIPLAMQKTEGKARTFMVNGAPILDVKGETRGALATFDDVTHIEAQNAKLQKMLGALKQSRDEVRRQNQALQVLATQDPLTGCLNRRAFFERFEVEFSRAKRYGHDLTCIMADIDHFKKINDEHGHQAGDKVLQKVSQTLKSCLRDTDLVCRYGGEEFCLTLTETDALGGLKTAERIRKTIEAEQILGVQVTISLGVSALEFQPANPTALISQADKSLYQAKNNGRNSAIVFSELVESLPQGSTGDRKPLDVVEPKPDTHIPHHVVKALMLALEHRDVRTAEHSRKVGELCVAAAQGLMPVDECATLEIAGQLHDIGKLGVPDAILLKPGPLTEEEWQIMHDHERRSIDVIASTFSAPKLVELVKYHSHWYDGSKTRNDSERRGQEIPLGARILNIADAFDAMVSQRPYRSARSYKEAFDELRRCAGTQFDPELVEHFIEVVNARDEARREDVSEVSDAIKLEIGREVENLLMAVNLAAWNDLTLSAERLAKMAQNNDLQRVAEVAWEIKAAADKNAGQIEIMNLSSKLLSVTAPLRSMDYNGVDDGSTTLAA